MNAANFQMADEVFGLVEEASKDDEVRVLIITGAGRGFHSGDDIKARLALWVHRLLLLTSIAASKIRLSCSYSWLGKLSKSRRSS